jgi:hypothetical protein
MKLRSVVLLMSAMSVFFTVPASAEPQIRGINMSRECDRMARTYTNYATSRTRIENPEDAYSWKCDVFTNRNTGTDAPTETVDFNLDRACQEQHGKNASARLGNPKNPYSWGCVVP